MEPAPGTAVAAAHLGHGRDAAILASAHASGELAGMPGLVELSGLAGVPETSGMLSPTMLVAHVLGTVVAAWLVARAEAILWRVIGVLFLALPAPLRPAGRAPLGTGDLVVAPRARLRAPVGSRGPPRPAP